MGEDTETTNGNDTNHKTETKDMNKTISRSDSETKRSKSKTNTNSRTETKGKTKSSIGDDLRSKHSRIETKRSTKTIIRKDTNTRTETKGKTKTVTGDDSHSKIETKGKATTVISEHDESPRTETTSRRGTRSRTETKGKTTTAVGDDSHSKTEIKSKTETVTSGHDTHSRTETKRKTKTTTEDDSHSKTETKVKTETVSSGHDINSRTETKGKTKTTTEDDSHSKTETKVKTTTIISGNDESPKSETTSRNDTHTITETKGKTKTAIGDDSHSKTKTKGKTETVNRTDASPKTTSKNDTHTRTETKGKTKTAVGDDSHSKTETKGKTETISRNDASPKTETIRSKNGTLSKTESLGRSAGGNEIPKREDIPGTTDETTESGRVSGLRPVCSTSPFQEGYFPEVYELLNRLDSEELTSLRIHFYERKIDEKIKEPKGSAHPRFRGFKLKKEEFISAIENVLCTNTYEEAANKLFERLVEHNAEEHKGFLWWEQILDELIEFMSEKTKSRPGNIVKESFCSLYPMSHCRRETIVRVVPVEMPMSFCFVVVSKYGKVGIYDWEMSLLEQFEVRLSTQIATTSGGEVRRTTWVTDALYMADAATLMVAASDRSLHFYAMSGLVCVPVYHISGLPNSPTCLHYTVSSKSEGQSMLLVGDDHGSIATMYFQQPQYALFRRTSNDALDKYFWKELSSQKSWVIIVMDLGIHKDEITRVEYFSDNNTVVSCSNDPQTTVIIRYIVGRRAPYVFKISRGVRCFHLDRSLRLLATGGKDSVVRLWNPIIPRKPVASLFGHKCCIVDVRILKHLNVILSMSKDTVVKVWDIEGQICMQSLPLLFPVHGALARLPEFGVQSFYPGPISCKPTSLPPPKKSTEVVYSPRTLTTASSSTLVTNEPTPVDSVETGKTTFAKEVLASAHLNKSEKTLSVKINAVVGNYSSDSSRIKRDSEIRSEFSGADNLNKVTTLSKETRTVTQYTAISEISDETGSCLGSSWTRMELLAVCCNYIVILQLSERELEEGEDNRVGSRLYAPLRNQDPAAPSPWLTVDPALLTGLADMDTPPPGEDDVPSSVPAAVLSTLEKSLGSEMTRNFTALASSCVSLESQQTDLTQIRAVVEQCAPHLALGTTDVENIPFTAPAALGKNRHKVEAHVKEAHKVTRASMGAEESSTSCSHMGTTTTTTSTSTQKSDKN